MDEKSHRISVGVYGATGYVGGEALRVLLENSENSVLTKEATC